MIKLILLLLYILLILTVIFLERKSPTEALLWVLVMVCLPYAGAILYLVFGSTMAIKLTAFFRKKRLAPVPDSAPASPKKAPAPGISENGREMLELYEKLPEREQILLIGRLQEMTAPLLGEVKKGGTTEAASSSGRAV